MRSLMIVAVAVALSTNVPSLRAQEPPIKPNVLAAYIEAFANKHAAGVARLYAENATLFPSNEPAIKGRAHIERWYQRVFASGVSSITMDSDQLVYEGPLAYHAGSYSVSVLCPSIAKNAVKETRRYILTLRRSGSGWLIDAHIFNTDAPSGSCK